MIERLGPWSAGFTLLVAACAAPPSSPEGDGPCTVSPPAERQACTQEYAPVCGCDGKTYPNGCEARQRGVPRSKPGACGGAGLE